jgi:RNA polymerase sigma-70 factor (ECF subfamily)
MERLRRWAAAKDQAALGELLKWQRDRAYAIALRVLGQAADAEDAVQDSFLKLLHNAPACGSVEEFTGVVRRSVVQCAIDAARKARTRRNAEQAMSERRGDAAAPATVPAERAEAARALEGELATLQPEDRALLALCCQEGASLSAAARTFGEPRETTRDRLKRLLGMLRGRLGGRGVTLSCGLLVLLLRDETCHAATPSLCSRLDAALPGAPCAGIQPAAAAAVNPAALLAEAGLSTAATVLKVAGVAAAVAVLAVGASALWGRGDAQNAGTGTQQVSPAPGTAPLHVDTPRVGAPPLTVEQSGTTAAKPAAQGQEAAARQIAPAQPADPNAIPLDQVPAAVRAAAIRAVPGFVLREADREEENGRIEYGLEGEADGDEVDFDIAPDGTILKMERKAKKERRKGGAAQPDAVPKPGEF